jgi:hypothetical protein
MYEASVPVLQHFLGALSAVLKKAEDHAAAKKIDPNVLLQARLYPDMFPLTRQVQIACDFAKGATARLAGQEPPAYDDSERSIADLQARIAKTIAFIRTVGADQIRSSEERDVTVKIAGNPRTFKGQTYLLSFAIPNFLFHLTAAYAILRHNGVDLGKRDFLGKVPGL